MALALLKKKSIVVMSTVGTIFGGTVLIKNLFVNTPYQGKEKLEGKKVIVTGANTGIGREVARDMMHRRAEVIMACKDMDKCEYTRAKLLTRVPFLKDKVTCEELDLRSMASVCKFASTIKEKHGKVDILVNNAGIMGFRKKLTEDGFETHLSVNHLGPFLLTKLLAAHVKDRIVSVACTLSNSTEIKFDDLNSQEKYHPDKVYRQSKLANYLCLTYLASGKSPVETDAKIIAVCPGMANTEITRHIMARKWFIVKPFYKAMCYILFHSPQQAAQNVIKACVDPNISNDSYIGGNLPTKIDEQHILAMDDDIPKRMWLTSERWIESRNISHTSTSTPSTVPISATQQSEQSLTVS